MMDRIIRAWTAWIHSPVDAGLQWYPAAAVVVQFRQRSEVLVSLVVHTLTIVDTNRRTSAAMCRKMIPSSRSSIFSDDFEQGAGISGKRGSGSQEAKASKRVQQR